MCIAWGDDMVANGSPELVGAWRTGNLRRHDGGETQENGERDRAVKHEDIRDAGACCYPLNIIIPNKRARAKGRGSGGNDGEIIRKSATIDTTGKS
jgi:hypothetical protein